MSKFDWRGIVAIDGPAGVGKSTVARLIAKRLGYAFINTGDMYRALTWKALREGIDIKNRRQVVRFLRSQFQLIFHVHDGVVKIELDGIELGRQLRSERVSRVTSTVAQIPQVRSVLRRLQRELALRGGSVLEGRDTTTHVAPLAGLKVFLDASVHERARRRYRQLLSDGKRVKFERIKEAIRVRDLREKKRGILPLRLSAGTVVVDTTYMTLHETADKILRLYRGRRD